MIIFDGHCDVLWKLWEHEQDFYNDKVSMQVNYHNMKKA
ncbi:MAG TPA: diguanylate cyclase, partial [Paenibacillaceae bacterium]|nr:diguanylate cyclase [Paenibacillaceae bacterium]